MLRFAIAAVLLAGCAMSQASGPQGASFDGGGVRFTAPVGWQVEPAATAPPGSGGWLVYVATQALHDRCSAEPAGSCRPPLDELVAGGVLVVWYTMNCAGPSCTLPDGERTRVGGREAVIVPSRNSCGQVGETEEADYLVAVSPQRIDTIVVCSRGATEATRQTVSSFLDGVVWRTP